MPIPITTHATQIARENSASARDAGQLSGAHHQVVGPFDGGVDRGGLEHEACTAASATRCSAEMQLNGADRGPKEPRHERARPRWCLPAPVEPTPPGGLMFGHGDHTLRRT